ncbi:hypothetical protein H2248_005952 [Termitomyces sp. 'cryptogamus']|nr:hypothetical protein H2248_005952 [Termitomyces sp. 'cryptogamus']
MPLLSSTLDIDANVLPPFQPPDRQDWNYVAYLVSWIVSLIQDSGIKSGSEQVLHRRLAFLSELPTLLERRNESTRRILRVLMDPSHSLPPTKDQVVKYWINALGHECVSANSSSTEIDKDQELLDLCRQFGEMGIRC